MSVDVQKVARTRYFTGRAYERDFQFDLSLGYSASLKEDRESLFVLRHERRFPATPASLVEKIGERVFILTSVLRELYHDSLIFFHADGRRRYV